METCGLGHNGEGGGVVRKSLYNDVDGGRGWWYGCVLRASWDLEGRLQSGGLVVAISS